MLKVKKIYTSIIIGMSLIATNVHASGVTSMYVQPTRLMVVENNTGRLYVSKDISAQCPSQAFRINLDTAGGKIMWQTLLTYEVSHQYTHLKVYSVKRDGFCWLQKVEVFSK